MTGLILYTTAGCHLCEQAEALLAAAGRLPGRGLTLVDIAGDPALVERYGVRIPVLAAAVGELAWPFDGEDLARFLAEAS